MTFNWPVLTHIDLGYPRPKLTLQQIANGLDLLYMDEALTDLLETK